MEQEQNDNLLNDLLEAKGSFDCIIQEMMDNEIPFSYDTLIKMFDVSYSNAYNAITRMNNYTKDYNYLMDTNEDYFDEEAKIIIGGIMIYIISIIAIKIFGKALSSRQIDEIWYMLIGMLFGSLNMGIIYSNINDHHNNNKDARALMNKIRELKENYRKDYEMATKEIDYMFALNRNLWGELDTKVLKKVDL